MKKFLLFASALAGFAVVAQAQEATTIKTTTVQYQVPTCTNCRTTTTTSTTYPEPEEVCETCVQPVVAQPVKMKRKEKRKLICNDNHELGIRNHIFTLREGQFSMQEVLGIYKTPKRPTHVAVSAKHPDGKDNLIERRGYNEHMTVVYGITDRWSIQALGGKNYSIPKTSQYRDYMNERWGDRYARPIPHSSGYNVNLSTKYHVLDLCHLDVFLGVQGMWNRNKSKQGETVRRENGYGWGPTATIGSNWGWFTPYVSGAYNWNRVKAFKGPDTSEKHWVSSDGWYVNPGIYIQPSKWVGFDFNVQKNEEEDAYWHAGVDFYPYKNLVFGVEAQARRPFRHPMHMYGVAGMAKIVF